MRPNKSLTLWDDKLDAILPLAGSMVAFIVLMVILVA
jgi:hypothetical protein